MKQLQNLYNPTLDGVEYSGLFAAILLKYSYAPTYLAAISAAILDGFMLHTYGESILRAKYADNIPAAYDAMYYALAAQESDIKRFSDLANKNFSDVAIIETITNAYGEDVTRKAYGAQSITHSLGQVQISVVNAARHNESIDYTSPYDVNTYAERAKSEQDTGTFTDTTTTNAHSNTDSHATHTDTDTRDERTDTTTRRAILQMSARDFYELEKLLINENMYNEISSVILKSVCICIY